MNNETFLNINFDTRPTTFNLEEIRVIINPEMMLNDYAPALLNELNRRNPIKFKAIDLSEEDVLIYLHSLIAARVACVRGNCSVWRQLKAVYMTHWIEFILTLIGIVIDTEKGIKLVPVFEGEINIEKTLEVSNKLFAFSNDGLGLVKDAMPRGSEGDYDTMSMALISGFICSQKATAHPIYSYAAAFLGFQLEKEAAFKMLYRVKYDDIEFIKSMLLREEKLYD